MTRTHEVHSSMHDLDAARVAMPRSETGAMRAALGMHYMRQLPLEALGAGAAALEYGSSKYENRNWEKGLPWQQMIDSLKRHVDDFERGRDYDDGEDGSGMHQVCMIMASAMMLSASVIRGIGEDDRMPPTGEDALTAKQVTFWIRAQIERTRKGDPDPDVKFLTEKAA